MSKQLTITIDNIPENFLRKTWEKAIRDGKKDLGFPFEPTDHIKIDFREVGNQSSEIVGTLIASAITAHALQTFENQYNKPADKRWEILEVYNPKQGTGEPHKKQYGGDMSCDNMGCIIYSVKHLDDNTVYKVGDTLSHISDFYMEKIQAIVKPNTTTDQMWFNPESNPTIVMSLSNFFVVENKNQ
jgi:hypothetical protein